MTFVCNGCLSFTEGIGMKIKRHEDKIDVVKMSILQFLSVIPDKLEVEDLIELLNIINEAAF